MLSGKPRKIIFIGHDATLSGAPILLLNLIKLLKESSDYKIKLIISREGVLLGTYKGVCKTIGIKCFDYSTEKRLTKRFYNLIRSKIQLTKALFLVFEADIVVSNTVVNGNLLSLFSIARKPIITYIHELQKVIDHYRKSQDGSGTFKYTSLFITPSVVVTNLLSNQYRVSSELIMPLDYYFPSVTISDYEKNDAAKKFRENHNIGNSFVVGSAGTISDRKGADLWLEVCRLVSNQIPEIKFCWIGEFENENYKSEILSRVKNDKLQDNLLFTGAMKNDILNFAPFNIFLLSSKEDTYPLVVLEAALLKIPTLCYANSGGIPEFVKDDSGWVVAGLSVELAAKQIIELYYSRRPIVEKGENAFKKVIEKHCNKTRVIQQFNEAIEVTLTSF